LKRLDPFKVRRGETLKAMESAHKIFGTPIEVFEGMEHVEMRWHFYDSNLFECGVEIEFRKESDYLSMNLQISATLADQTIFGPVLSDKSAIQRIEEFVKEVKKPWAEWEEDEIMKSPMWVQLYKEDGNQPSQAMDNMMHMASFENPNNSWVKKYFEREAKVRDIQQETKKEK